MPVSEMCSLCSPEIEYDFIIKFENLAEEEKYFIERLELELEGSEEQVKTSC